MKLIAHSSKIGTVGELAEALNKMPKDTEISPLGALAHLVYDENKGVAYLDEDFSWIEDDDEYDDLERQIEEAESEEEAELD